MRLKPTTIIFCLPGNNFTLEFLKSWSELTMHCMRRSDIEFMLSPHYSCDVRVVRNMCLGVSPGLVPVDTKPFIGNVKYDYLMWIDSDQVFTTAHFDRLLDKALKSDYHIVSGTYRSAFMDSKQDKLDRTVCRHKSTSPRTMTLDELKNMKTDKYGLAEIHSNGFGWMMVKYGVFEAMQYPWFREDHYIDDKGFMRTPSEDVVFSRISRKNGFKTYLAPDIVVGHEKRLVL